MVVPNFTKAIMEFTVMGYLKDLHIGMMLRIGLRYLAENYIVVHHSLDMPMSNPSLMFLVLDLMGFRLSSS
jgi:hypothetical protein